MIYKTFSVNIHKKIIQGVSIEPGETRKTLAKLREQGVEHLTIVGWENGESLDFLADQHWIKGLLISSSRGMDIGPINTLSNLEHLVFYNNNVNGVIDFKKLLKLRKLKMAFSDKRYANFNSLKHIESLEVYYWPFEDLANLTHLSKIELLELNFSTKMKSLSGIRKLKKLDFLNIYSASKLEDIDEVESNYKTLRRLSFDLAKKIQNFYVLESLPNLERIYIDKCSPLHSIQWLKKLKKLQWGYIGVEVLDGDIQFLKDRKIEYKKMRKYSTGQ